jgi:hypothetical protein
MATINLPKLGSFHRGDLHLVRGLNANISAFLISDDMLVDPRFEVVFDPGEREAAAVAADVEGELDANGVPKDKQTRLRYIIGAIDAIPVDAEDAYTSTGKLDARYLTSMLGWQVSSTDRDTAVKLHSTEALEGIPYSAPEKKEETHAEPAKEDAGDTKLAAEDLTPPKEQPAPQSAPKGSLKLSSKAKKAAAVKDATTEGAEQV